MTAEHRRLAENAKKPIPLEKWGPYVSERQWGTVREDYSQYGDAWHYFPFEHSHSRAYRWGEDGIGGICDFFSNLCFSIALWNGKDPILKERLFGLGNREGNHGEDVKELYYHLDNIPSHFYMQYLYKYPQQAFPYQQLREENKRRGKEDTEFEILDTGVFDKGAYFDVLITYAKHSSNDIFIKIDITNRYSEKAPVTVLPTLWFFNNWATGELKEKPIISKHIENVAVCKHERLGDYYFYYQEPDTALYTENVTNTQKLFNLPNQDIFVKDAINDAIVSGQNRKELAERHQGTKFSPVYELDIAAGATHTIYCRLSNRFIKEPFFEGFNAIFSLRKQETDAFYNHILSNAASEDLKLIQRKALSGILWSKQYYQYDVERWLYETDGITPVSVNRQTGRNSDWKHLKNHDIISMPDKWEYPWYAAWDLAFQCIPLAVVDPVFAKHQLLLIMREWYMKPDGQLPSYEWNFNDVNPPVHAWAALQVYEIEKKATGKGDIVFLKKIFQKLLINFTWWINRKDVRGNNLFEGGFLGLDNIGVFNRSISDNSNIQLEQADGTSWMGTYALDMMKMALEISLQDESFEDVATKFFEHFVLIAESLNEHGLWNEEDQFFYDMLLTKDAAPVSLRIQSIVGLTALYAVSTISKEMLNKLPDFKKRITWFENYRKKQGKFWPNEERSDKDGEILLSLVQKERLTALLTKLLDEDGFLSPGGIRGLSKFHKENHYSVEVQGEHFSIAYDPGDSTSDFYGGNSNWRGPVWMPINFIIIQSIRKYGDFYGEQLKVPFPTHSQNMLTLNEVADELTKRVISLFERQDGERRIYAEHNWFFSRPENKELLTFYEYFNGDSGRGLGASHQTGWTALVADLIADIHNKS